MRLTHTIVAFTAVSLLLAPGAVRAEDFPEPADPLDSAADAELDGYVRGGETRGPDAASAADSPTVESAAETKAAPDAEPASAGTETGPEIVDLGKLVKKPSPGEEAVNDLFRSAAEPESDELGSFEDILGGDSDTEAIPLPDGPPFDLLKKSPQLKGLALRHRIVAAAEGDFDGNGLREYVVAFGPGKQGRAGGFAIIAFRAGKFRLAWAGLYERSAPEDVYVQGGSFRARVRTPNGVVPVVLEHGTDFQLRGDSHEPFKDAKLKVSSKPRGVLADELAPEHLLDGDYETVWCTETIGTGVGEWIQVEFAKPVDVGIVGVIGGDYRGEQQWKDSNRLFRYELIAETKSDRTTLVEEMDLTKMLKLPTIGKRVSVTADDAMQSSWADVAHKGVVGLKLETASVHFGMANDELCVAELEIGFLLPEPKKPPPPPPMPVATPVPGAPELPAPSPAAAGELEEPR